MKITDISIQAKNNDRVNVGVDGKYRFSLDIFQVGELGIKVGREYSEDEINSLETESQFGKLYVRALEYTLMRPHSAKEIKDYLWKKTRATKIRNNSGELVEKSGYSPALAERVFEKLSQKKYIDDLKFARWWVENRNQTKGTSRRRLVAELRVKGISSQLVEEAIGESSRSDQHELAKMIAKKRNKYPDDQKLIQYLARQGFGYDDIKSALAD